jgi:hypothetical protein
MTFAIAGLIARGETEIDNADCVDISFPTFWQDLERLRVHPDSVSLKKVVTTQIPHPPLGGEGPLRVGRGQGEGPDGYKNRPSR